MPEIKIKVRDKCAEGEGVIICNNSDYTVVWDLDGEWTPYGTKTMRVNLADGTYQDVVFTGDNAALPVLTASGWVSVGLYAGDLHTSRAARLLALSSVLTPGGSPAAPAEDVYAQIMAKLNELSTVSPEDIAQAVADYLTEHPIEETDPTVPEWAKAKTKPTYSAAEVGAISQSDLQAATDAALAQAKASGEFDGPAGPQGPAGAPGKDGTAGADGVTPHIGDNGNWYLGTTDTGKPSRGAAGSAGQAGKDGKSAYQYAQEGGYTGTETEFAAKLAEEMPDKLPNPNAITFTGAVSGSYDGSAPLEVAIPSGEGGTGGGSSGTWELIGEVTSDGTGDSNGIYVPIDFTQYKEVFIEAWIAANVINRVLMSSRTAWYDGQVLNTNSKAINDFNAIDSPHTENVLAQTIIYNICGELKPFSSWCSGYANGNRPVLQVSSVRNTYLATSYSYIRLDTGNKGAVAEGNWLKVWGRK